MGVTTTNPEKLGRVLVVDDDEQVVRLIRLVLEGAGYTCHSAWSGAQALGRLASGEVDVVVTDLNMAVGDRITLIETIRKTSDVAVIVVSGFAAQYAQRALAFENVSVLPKPLDTAALLALVRARLMEAWQSRQASCPFNEAVAIG